MAVSLTSSYWKIKKLTKRYRVVKGSMSASKTYSILISLFQEAIEHPGTRITIITSTYPLLIDGVVQDMKNIFSDAGLEFSKYYNKSSKDLTYENGSNMQFRNLDSLNIDAGKGSRRDILFINEANRLSYEALDAYIVRTDKYIIFDYNPNNEFWIDERYINKQREDVDHITLTYLDNELIPQGELDTLLLRKAEAEKPGASDAIINWWNVYGLGLIGSLSDRQIYTYAFCNEIPASAMKIYSGLDVAQSPDQTALLDIYMDGANLYLDERFSLNGLLPVKITGAQQMAVVDQFDLIGFPKGQIVVCDSANLSTIIDLRKYGYNVYAAKKPKFSQKDGLLKTRSYNLHITKTSPSIKKAIENWFWKVDHNGKIIAEPQGHEPDILAAFRYAIFLYKK